MYSPDYTKIDNTQACPCCSGKKFNECCGLYLVDKKVVLTAEQLMRSRYTAFYFKDAQYLYDTTHPSTRVQTSVEAIYEWALETQWTQLEVTMAKEKKVTFKAYYTDLTTGKSHIHHEFSTFKKWLNRWFYVDGTIVD